MVVNLWSAQRSVEKSSSWRILGQPLRQMINNAKHREEDEEMDDGSIKKTSES